MFEVRYRTLCTLAEVKMLIQKSVEMTIVRSPFEVFGYHNYPKILPKIFACITKSHIIHI